MKPLQRFKCSCGRAYATSLCARMGRVDVWVCSDCAAAWWREYWAEVAARAAA